MRFYDAETRRAARAARARRRRRRRTGCEAALALARDQGARPFELRIALDLDELDAAAEAATALEAAVAGFRPDAELADLDAARARLAADRVTRARPASPSSAAAWPAMAAAWRLSEPGWAGRARVDHRLPAGWRLGGKGASSRGAHGRIEEHGLHLWLGYYENAFRLLRECYAELDRAAHRPDGADPHVARRDAPHRGRSGLEDRDADGWHHWVGQFTPNDRAARASPSATGREVTMVDLAAPRAPAGRRLPRRRSPTRSRSAPARWSLSASAAAPDRVSRWPTASRSPWLPAILEATARLHGAADRRGLDGAVAALDRALAAVRRGARATRSRATPTCAARGTSSSVMTASVRGMLADGLLTDRRGFRAHQRRGLPRLDHAPRRRRRRSPTSRSSAGLYDLVFADGGADRADRGGQRRHRGLHDLEDVLRVPGRDLLEDGGGHGRHRVRAALRGAAAARRALRVLPPRRPAAPVGRPHADRRRSPSAARRTWRRRRASTTSRSSASAACPCFPAGAARRPARRGRRHRATNRSSRTGAAGPTPRCARCAAARTSTSSCSPSRVGMAALVCRELIDDRPEWRAMVDHAVHDRDAGLQLWLREDEPTLGWPQPGRDGQRLRAALQHLGVDAAAHRRRSSGRTTTGPARSPTSAARSTRRGRPTRRRTRYVARHQRARPRQRRRARRARPPAPAARRVATGRRSAGTCCAGATAHAGRRALDTQLVPRQRRPVRPLRAVRARAPTATGCGPTRAATTTSSSPATGPTTASTPAASRPRPCRASRPPTPCSADRGSTASPASTSAGRGAIGRSPAPVPRPVQL